MSRTARAGTSVSPDALIGAITLLGILALGILLILRAPGLGWDEAVYATKARSFVTDIPDSAWNLFRPPGLAWLGVAAAPFGFFDESVRVTSLVLGVAGLGAYGVLTRLVAGPAAALAAVLVAISMPIVLVELPLFHNDLASAGVLFALMALLWHQLEVRPTPDRRLLLTPVLAAAAFYLRYGALLPLFGIGASTVVLWGPTLWRNLRLTVAVPMIGLVLALPHLLLAMTETGSPFGILQLSAEQTGTSDAVESIGIYVRALPWAIAGPLGLVFLAAGAALAGLLALRLLRRRSVPSLTRPASWLLLPAVVTTVVLVLVSHAEPRYILFPAMLVSAAGAMALSRAVPVVLRRAGAARGSGAGGRRPVVAALGLLLAVVVVLVGLRMTAPTQMAPDQAAWARRSGHWIRDHSTGPCLVVSTIYPILGWYAECASNELHDPPRPLLPDDAPPDQTYIVFTSYDPRRRDPETLARYRAIVSGPLATFGNRTAGAEVTLVRQ